MTIIGTVNSIKSVWLNAALIASKRMLSGLSVHMLLFVQITLKLWHVYLCSQDVDTVSATGIYLE